ncbi:MAG: hypothetical protein HYZ29_12935 [Myxococcales bacterium]|nr:hypothetical protein [Myxococcales bacterium]
MTSEEIQRLRAELASDQRAFEARVAELGTLDASRATAAETAQLAVLLHHAYGAIEAALARIARVLERGLPEGPDWHAALVHEMALEIPSVRPAVLSAGSAAALRKLLAFRHFFRHAYAAEWDRQQLGTVRQVAVDAAPQLVADLAAFDVVLARLAAELARG